MKKSVGVMYAHKEQSDVRGNSLVAGVEVDGRFAVEANVTENRALVTASTTSQVSSQRLRSIFERERESKSRTQTRQTWGEEPGQGR